MQTFQDKVRSMSAKEIIMNMVEALQDPILKVAMNTFGDAADGICYGCAATNSICRIAGVVFTEGNIERTRHRAKFIGSSEDFLSDFEDAIDSLRRGHVIVYNYLSGKIDIALITIPVGFEELPKLHNDYTQEQLEKYINLANVQ
jgi:hypothetical protein